MGFNIGSSFGYIARDPNWTTKAGIGVGALLAVQFFSNIPLVGLLALPFVLLVNLALMGYQVQIIRTVAAGRDDELPEWMDVGNLLMTGVMLFLAWLLWNILPIGMMIGGGVSFIVAAVSAGGSGRDFDPSQLLAAGAGMGGVVLLLVALLLMLVIAVFFPMVTLRYATTLRLGEAFKFGEIFGGIGRSVGSYIMILLVGLAIGLVGGGVAFVCAIVLSIIPLIGPPLVSFISAPLQFYTMVVMGNLLGQYQRSFLEPLDAGYAPQQDWQSPSAWAAPGESPAEPSSPSWSSEPAAPEAPSWGSEPETPSWSVEPATTAEMPTGSEEPQGEEESPTEPRT